jgi:hypothetical protein
MQRMNIHCNLLLALTSSRRTTGNVPSNNQSIHHKPYISILYSECKYYIQHSSHSSSNMPPKKSKGGGSNGNAATTKKPAKPKAPPKRQLHANEVVKKHLGASHGEVQRIGDKLF